MTNKPVGTITEFGFDYQKNLVDLDDYVKKESITDVVRDNDITDVVRDNDITDVVRTADITDVVRTDNIANVLRRSNIKFGTELRKLQSNESIAANSEGSLAFNTWIEGSNPTMTEGSYIATLREISLPTGLVMKSWIIGLAPNTNKLVAILTVRNVTSSTITVASGNTYHAVIQYMMVS